MPTRRPIFRVGHIPAATNRDIQATLRYYTVHNPPMSLNQAQQQSMFNTAMEAYNRPASAGLRNYANIAFRQLAFNYGRIWNNNPPASRYRNPNLNSNSNSNRNSNNSINTIPMPNRLRNNTNVFTGQRFKYGVPYVEAKSNGIVHYYTPSEFKKWSNLKKSKGQPVTNLFTRKPLNNKNIRLVKFAVSKNIQNKANNLRKKRAARTVQKAFRNYRWKQPN